MVIKPKPIWCMEVVCPPSVKSFRSTEETRMGREVFNKLKMKDQIKTFGIVFDKLFGRRVKNLKYIKLVFR